MVTIVGLMSSAKGHSSWPLPVIRVSDTAYESTGGLKSGRVQEMLSDVAFSNVAVTCGATAPVIK